jgi:hypothetical protein
MALAFGFVVHAIGIVAMRRTIAGVGTFDIVELYPHAFTLTNVNTGEMHSINARNEWHALAILKAFG